MPLIEILSDDLINKIAAGEVIERPASVVKELIENSIDASCHEIKVDTLYGGKGLIRVSDDGNGMDRDDALTCFQRHATSKIKKEADLFNIHTMGFRGEALSSIASVSRMKIVTSTIGSMKGTLIEIHGGVVRDTRDKAIKGTTIEVRDIFHNMPARKKFLKSNSTELYHIVDMLTQIALSHPDKRIILYADEREVMNLPVASGIQERIAQIYGNEFLKGLEHFEETTHEFSIEGFVSKVGNFRKARSHQYFFVNQRPIKDNSLRHAIYQAYKDILPESSHPLFFVYLYSSPSGVDFNVHPTKREVRFYDKDIIYNMLFHSIRDTIEKSRVTSYESRVKTHQHEAINQHSTFYNTQHAAGNTQHTANLEIRESPSMPYSPMRHFIYGGDVFVAYPDKDGICILDHHACHERILYERLRDGVKLTPHQLLFPLQVRLPKKEHSLLLDHLDELRKMGIEIDEFGMDTFIIRALPLELDDADMVAILSDIATHFVDHTSLSPVDDVRDIIAKRIACHSSVRGKRVLNNEELNQLLRDLDLAKNPNHCPHGRPTRLYFSLDELRKMFGRK